MKKLTSEEMIVTEGGIACADIPAVLDYLSKNNWDQYVATIDFLYHSGNDIQCD